MYGIILDEKIEKKLLKQKKYQLAYCIHAKTPTKSGMITHFSINWMFWLKLTNKVKKETANPIDIIRLFYEDMSGYPRKYLDNTIDFIEKEYNT